MLLLHGEPSWSFLYRAVMKVLADAGLRVIAADMIGFGRSDKPAEIGDHSFARTSNGRARWLSTASASPRSPSSARTGAG